MIPVCEPYLIGKELEYVTDCLKTNWISSQGKYIEMFEEQFAEYCDCEHGVTTTSGTTALHLALATLGMGRGDEVIIPTFTNIATAFAVIYTGAKPVLVDSESETYNIDTSKIEEKITSRTRAIIPVHIYGHPCQMSTILQIALDHDLCIVEDACESHGAEYKGKKTGSLSHVGCFSTFANKIITSGEGGIIVTNDKKLAERARRLKDLAHSPERRFLHTDIAFNYRMSNVTAAIALAQLENIDKFIEMRRANALMYNSFLWDIKQIKIPIEQPWVKNVYWMYAIQIEGDKFKFMKHLQEKGIQTREFFIPMHQQPCFEGMFDGEEYPVAEGISQKGLYLPSGTGLNIGDIAYICRCIKEYFK